MRVKVRVKRSFYFVEHFLEKMHSGQKFAMPATKGRTPK
jgi:hypothetical protein